MFVFGGSNVTGSVTKDLVHSPSRPNRSLKQQRKRYNGASETVDDLFLVSFQRLKHLINVPDMVTEAGLQVYGYGTLST